MSLPASWPCIHYPLYASFSVLGIPHLPSCYQGSARPAPDISPSTHEWDSSPCHLVKDLPPPTPAISSLLSCIILNHLYDRIPPRFQVCYNISLKKKQNKTSLDPKSPSSCFPFQTVLYNKTGKTLASTSSLCFLTFLSLFDLTPNKLSFQPLH